MSTLEKEIVTATSMDAINYPTIKEIVSIRIGAISIHKLRIIARADGALWVALPKTEKHPYEPIIEVHSARLKRMIDDVVLSYWSQAKDVDTVALLHSFGNHQPRNQAYERYEKTRPERKALPPVFGERLMANDDISDVGR